MRNPQRTTFEIESSEDLQLDKLEDFAVQLFQCSPSYNVDVVPERSEGDELTNFTRLPAKQRWERTKAATETEKEFHQ